MDRSGIVILSVKKVKKSVIFVKSNFLITPIFEEVYTSEYLHAMLR